MSNLSNRFRAFALERNARQARQYALDLWITLNVAVGMGAWIPDGDQRLRAAVDDAERLTLEWHAAV